MKAMSYAHSFTKAQTLGSAIRGYQEVFCNFLAHAHKVEKQVARRDAKYLVTHAVGLGNFANVDIRDLPTFSASRDVIRVGVEHWTIKGKVKTRYGWNSEAHMGCFLDSLNESLAQWVNFAGSYNEFCLLLEFNGNLYRLIK